MKARALRNKAAIAGIGCTDFSRDSGRTEYQLALEAAVARLPLLECAGLVAHWAGLYEVTPDAHPILGRTPVEGFYVVAGFSGHGFMHGPVCGLLMAEEILDGQATTVDISSLAFSRFAEGKLIREYNVI